MLFLLLELLFGLIVPAFFSGGLLRGRLGTGVVLCAIGLAHRELLSEKLNQSRVRLGLWRIGEFCHRGFNGFG